MIKKSAFQLSEKMIGCPVQSIQTRQSREQPIGNSVPQAQALNPEH